MNNGMPPDYGFNMPDYSTSSSPAPAPAPPSSYGYNQHTSVPPYQPTNNPTNDSFVSGQFATQLLSEPLVTNMAMQYGNALATTGKHQIERFLPITALRYYFAVDTDYVMMKLLLLFFPFTHKVK